MDNHSAQPIRQTSASTGILSHSSITAIIFLTWLLIFVPGLSRPGLLDDADSVHAEASREMLLTNDWVTLHVDGIRYLEKAPLMYWAVAASFKFFGVGEWQVRLPLALGVLGMMWCAYLFGRRAFGNEGALYAALIMGTAPGIYIFTRFMIPDVWVVVWLTASIYLFWIVYEQENPSRWACWGLAVTVALNVLTKSLIGLAFPVMIIFVFVLITGELRKLARLRLFSSTLVFLAVAAPWHILAAIRNPAAPSGPQKGFLWFYFWNEQFMRYLNKRVPHDYGKVPLLIFYGLLLLWIVPWCAFLFPALKEIPGRVRAWRAGLDQRQRVNLLLGTWAVLIVAFFSFSSRQEYYSLPAVPAMALLIAGWLERESNSPASSLDRRAGRIASSVMLVIGITVFIATMAILWKAKSFPPATDLGDVLTQHPGQYKLSLGHMQDLTIESFGMFRSPLWILGVSLFVGTALNWILRRRGQALRANLALTGMMVAVLFAVYQGYVIFSPVISSKSLALQIKRQYKPGETIVIYHDYEFGSTLNFYAGIPVHMLNGRRADLWFGSFFPDAPHVFEDDESFARLWKSPARVYFFLEESDAEEALKGIDPKTVFVFARSGGKVILTNHLIQMGSPPVSEPHARINFLSAGSASRG
ncbi:MAG TPA: glycosyltransferase family 39 protein [Candidatus Limnocylindria bacterium]|nr:glycosyltransferase family 39 protein [Candidatus Limnocylindria bacterium]